MAEPFTNFQPSGRPQDYPDYPYDDLPASFVPDETDDLPSSFVPDDEELPSSFVPDEPTPTAPPKKSIFARLGSFYKQSNKDFLIGFGKGMGETLAGASSLGEKIISAPGQALQGKGFITGTVGDEINQSGILDTKGATQAFGKGVERVAEAVVAGAATGGASTVVGKAALSAGTMGSLEALHQGEINKEVGTSAAIAGGTSLAVSGASALLKKVAKGAWSTILKRTPSEALKEPGLDAEASKLGITGVSRESILKKITTQIQQTETALAEQLDDASGKISGKSVAPYLDSLKKLYGSIPGMTELADDVAALQDEYVAKGAMSAVEANALKRNIYQMIERSYDKGALKISVDSAAQKAAARGLKTEIEKIAPEVKDLNTRMGVLLGMKEALAKTVARMEGKGIWGTSIGLLDLGLGGIGTLVGVAGAPVAGAAIATSKVIGEQPLVLSGVAKLANYFNALSPTQKMLFSNAISGLINEFRPKEKKKK